MSEPRLDNENPQAALSQIRSRLKAATKEYSSGRLNAVQFNAIYRHYMEKRQIIERLVARDPETDAWKAAASPGTTAYIRDRFEARPLYYVIFRKDATSPLLAEGKIPKVAARQIFKLLQGFWKTGNWRTGLARKEIEDGMWLLLMVGRQSLTIVVYFLQPSIIQLNQLRDLHGDFERANAKALERNLPAKRMVFPQRAILDKQ
ncbi:MAG: hypothetical protein AAFV98_01185 [Chloroflexota bacterium]